MLLLHNGLVRITSLGAVAEVIGASFGSSSRKVADGVWWMQTIPLWPARRFCRAP
jgi:hypothetical protein